MSGKRADTLLVPGASLLFPHVLSYQTDIRFDYRYIHDNLNNSTKSFTDHVVTGTLIYRFDLTQPFWAQNVSAARTR